MPVLHHDTHPLVIGGALNGCHNRQPFAEGYMAPNGYAEIMDDRDTGIDARISLVFVEHRMSTECRYDMSLTDTKCAGCKHQGSGERYADRIRKEGK